MAKLILIVVILLNITLTVFANVKHPDKITNISHQDATFLKKLINDIKRVDVIIMAKRRRLLRYFHEWKRGKSLSHAQLNWLHQLANYYHVKKPNFKQEETWYLLVKRVDIIPTSLTLAQSINETAWGRSRFAREANNYFGRWCYKPGCGVIPRKRPPGETYEIKRYPSMYASVRDYVHILNAYRPYRRLRELRYQMRHNNNKINGSQLAKGLHRYSQIGHAYIPIIQRIIQQYRLHRFDE